VSGITDQFYNMFISCTATGLVLLAVGSVIW
jgi:hypothetical protein